MLKKENENKRQVYILSVLQLSYEVTITHRQAQ